jgi:hypothetical protein
MGFRTVTDEVKKYAFDLWMELGSIQKVADRFEAEGYRNSHNRPYPVSHIVNLANEYMLYNFEAIELRKHIDVDRARFGKGPISDEEYDIFLIHKAARLWGRSSQQRFFMWIHEHGFEKYADYWVKLGYPREISLQRYTRYRTLA